MSEPTRMEVHGEMLVWVGFTEADEARLRALWPHVEPRIEEVVDRFYDRILANPTARRVFRDEAQILRQKRTLRLWIAELLEGPRDEAYVVKRQRVGQVHVEVGLPARYMFTAMSVIREALCDIARDADPTVDAAATCRSIDRACDVDLAIMTGTYVQEREEQQLASLQDLIVSHLPVTVLLLDQDGLVTSATRPGTRLFGDVPVLGRRYLDALPEPLVVGAGLEAQMARALKTNREIVLSRVDVTLDRQERNFRISLVPLDHPQARMLLHLEELTDTVTTEARMRRNESLAQLGALSAGVAHELRNPLAGISGAIQVISRSLPDGDRRKPIMEKVEQQVRRLDSLVTELLQFARPTDARRVDVDLLDIARAVVESTAADHPYVDIEVTGEGRAVADPNLTQQIVLNLVLNAAQAVRGEDAVARTGTIQVRVDPGRVTVQDSGPGVPEENVARVFTPFFTTRTRGTGLGLAICRKLAQAMGGEMLLEQEIGSGARFTLQVPVELG